MNALLEQTRRLLTDLRERARQLRAELMTRAASPEGVDPVWLEACRTALLRARVLVCDEHLERLEMGFRPKGDPMSADRDYYREECRVDCLCADACTQTAAILGHEEYAERFRRLPVEEQAALRAQSHALMTAAVALHHRVLDALGLPRDTTV